MHVKQGFRNEFSKLKQNQKLLAILLLLFVCAISWTVVSIFTSQTSSNISPKQKKAAEPLNPVLDVETISRIENKRYITAEELVDFEIYRIVISNSGRDEVILPLGAFPNEGEAASTPTLTNQPFNENSATESAQPIPTPTPSPSPTPINDPTPTATTNEVLP